MNAGFSIAKKPYIFMIFQGGGVRSAHGIFAARQENTRFSHAVVQIKEVMAMLDKIPEYS